MPEITAQEICKEMVEYDHEQAKQHALLKMHGHQVTQAKGELQTQSIF